MAKVGREVGGASKAPAVARRAGKLTKSLGRLLASVIGFFASRDWARRWLNVCQFVIVVYALDLLWLHWTPTPTALEGMSNLQLAVLLYGGALGTIGLLNLGVLLLHSFSRPEGNEYRGLILETGAVVGLLAIPFVWNWIIDPSRPEDTFANVRGILLLFAFVNIYQWARSGGAPEPPSLNEEQAGRIGVLAGRYHKDLDELTSQVLESDDPDATIAKLEKRFQEAGEELNLNGEELDEAIRRALADIYVEYAEAFAEIGDQLEVRDLEMLAWGEIARGVTDQEEILDKICEGLDKALEGRRKKKEK